MLDYNHLDIIGPVQSDLFGQILIIRQKTSFCNAQLQCERLGGNLMTLTTEQLFLDASMKDRLDQMFTGSKEIPLQIIFIHMFISI